MTMRAIVQGVNEVYTIYVLWLLYKAWTRYIQYMCYGYCTRRERGIQYTCTCYALEDVTE
jgi:hypothetical protein